VGDPENPYDELMLLQRVSRAFAHIYGNRQVYVIADCRGTYKVRRAESVSRRYSRAARLFRSRNTTRLEDHKRSRLLSVAAELVIEHVSDSVAEGIMGSHQSALSPLPQAGRLPRRN
jgi:hypothetical protein